MTVTLAVTASVLTLALSGSGMLETDQHRTAITQNLRNGVDLLGIDVRQVGERLPADFPAVELIDGGADPDVLILRRSLLPETLPVCKDVKAGSSSDSVFVAKTTGGVPLGCHPVADDDGDGWPENLESWRDYRASEGGTVQAYIYNPITGDGEFFDYDQEDNSTLHMHRANPGKWQHDYDVDDEPRLFLLEERMIQVSQGLLQEILNQRTDQPLNLVTKIRDFQARAFLQDGSVLVDFGPGDDWTELESVEIALTGESSLRTRTMDRGLVTRFFPRNVMSR